MEIIDLLNVKVNMIGTETSVELVTVFSSIRSHNKNVHHSAKRIFSERTGPDFQCGAMELKLINTCMKSVKIEEISLLGFLTDITTHCTVNQANHRI